MVAWEETFGFRASSEAAAERLRSWLPQEIPFSESPDPEVGFLYSFKQGGETGKRGRRDFHLLYVGGTQLTRSLDLEEVKENFQKALLLAARAHATDRVYLTGKTTTKDDFVCVVSGPECARAVEHLKLRGWNVAQDSAALLNTQGNAVYFAGSAESFKITHFLLADEEVKTAGQMRPSEAAMVLMGGMYSARFFPRIAIKAAAGAAESAPVYRTSLTDLDETVATMTSKSGDIFAN